MMRLPSGRSRRRQVGEFALDQAFGAFIFRIAGRTDRLLADPHQAGVSSATALLRCPACNSSPGLAAVRLDVDDEAVGASLAPEFCRVASKSPRTTVSSGMAIRPSDKASTWMALAEALPAQAGQPCRQPTPAPAMPSGRR